MRLEGEHRAVGRLEGHRQCEVAPSTLESVPVIANFEQFVGLNVKFGRLIVTLTCWICSGMPSRMVGILYGPESSLVIVSAAVIGFTSIFALTTTLARWPGLQVERPGLRGVHDRQAERRALVRAGDVHLAAGHAERVAADADADGRFADQAFRAAGARVGLRFSAELRRRRACPRARAAYAIRSPAGSGFRLCDSSSS